MRKIAFLINELNIAGAQVMLFELLKKIHNNYEIKIIVKNCEQKNELEKGIEVLENVKVVYIGEKNNDNRLKKVRNYLRFKNELDSFNPDLIHCHLVETYAFWYSLSRNKKMIFTIHSWPDRILNKKNNYRRIKKLIDKKLVHFVGCAKCVSKRFKEIMNDLNANYNYISTIYNPIDLEQFKYIKRDNTINNDCYSFITVGRLSSIKNQKMLINAFSMINNKCKLDIVGVGDLEQDLKDLVNSLKLNDRVIFHGNKPNNKVNEMMANSDCFVLTSDSECCPVVLLEAMALGVPIITTDVGGTAEITNGASILVEKGNVKELANAMKKIIVDDKLRNNIVNIGKNQIKQFDSNTIASEYMALYNTIL